MSAAHAHATMLPRGTLLIACALVIFALTVTSVVRIAGIAPAASPAAMRAEEHIAAVKSRNLRFVDRADGAVVIEDVGTNGRSGGIASVIAPGQQTGFIRGVMRGLARERRAHGIGSGPPFTLTLWRDGELSLTDTATGRAIELTAFGTLNRGAFLAVLNGKGAGA